MPKKKFKRVVVIAVISIKKYIDANPVNGKSTTALAKDHGIGRNALQEIFKEKFNTPIGQYKLKLRMEAAQQQLKAGRSIKEVAFILKYSSPSSFSNAFRNYYNTSASQWLNESKYNSNKHGQIMNKKDKS